MNNQQLLKNKILSISFLIAIWSCHSQKADTPILRNDIAGTVSVAKHLSSQEIQRYHAAVEEVIDRSLLHGSFNGSILVAKNGDIVYEKYAGVKDPRIKVKD